MSVEGSDDVLGLNTLSLKKSGQAYFTVGNSFDFDIVLPKLSLTLGGQFAILKKGGHYFVKDMSIHGDAKTLFKLAKSDAQKLPYPIATGDVLVLASIFYNVDSAGANYKLTKIKELTPPADAKK